MLPSSARFLTTVKGPRECFRLPFAIWKSVVLAVGVHSTKPLQWGGSALQQVVVLPRLCSGAYALRGSGWLLCQGPAEWWS